VSVDASEVPQATVTPILTTVDGVATTLNVASTNPTATTTLKTNGELTDVPLPDGGGSYLVCHATEGESAPFCKPENGSSVYVGETYYGKIVPRVLEGFHV
jgi:hypothetical protein